MAESQQVVHLAVGTVLEPDDRAAEVPPDCSLIDVAREIRLSPARTAIVSDGARVLGVVTQLDVAEAIAQGVSLESLVGDLITDRHAPLVVGREVALQDLPAKIGNAQTVVVIDPGGKPLGVVDRQQLADRIIKRF